MTINSSLMAVAVQADGRRRVQESHVDQFGQDHPRFYQAGVNDDLAVAMSAYAAQIDAALVADDVADNLSAILTLGSDAAVTARYASLADVRAALRGAYQTATRLQAIMLGDYLAGLGDGVLRALFGMTANQVTALRADRLTPAANVAASIRAAAGQ